MMRGLLNFIAGFTIFIGIFLILLGGSGYNYVGALIVVVDITTIAVLALYSNPAKDKNLEKFAIALAIIVALTTGLILGYEAGTMTGSTSTTSAAPSALYSPFGHSVTSSSTTRASGSLTTVTFVNFSYVTTNAARTITITKQTVFQPVLVLGPGGQNCNGTQVVGTRTLTEYTLADQGQGNQSYVAVFTTANTTATSTSTSYSSCG